MPFNKRSSSSPRRRQNSLYCLAMVGLNTQVFDPTLLIPHLVEQHGISSPSSCLAARCSRELSRCLVALGRCQYGRLARGALTIDLWAWCRRHHGCDLRRWRAGRLPSRNTLFRSQNVYWWNRRQSTRQRRQAASWLPAAERGTRQSCRLRRPNGRCSYSSHPCRSSRLREDIGGGEPEGGR